MHRAFEEGDDETLAKLAHWLKGSAGTAGFEAFTPIAKDLEFAIKNRSRHEIQSQLQTISRMVDCMQIGEPND